MSNDLIIIDKYCQLNKTNLIFKRDITQIEWMTVFKSLKTVEGCVQFWIGDCLSYRQQKWGMYDDIAEETGYDKDALRDFKYVSENVKSAVRTADLSFNHHRQVAALTPIKQEKFLKEAIEKSLSVKELKEEIKKDKRGDDKRHEQPLPEGTYQVILADPPWKYNNTGFEMSAENKYPCMSVDDILNKIKFKTTENAILFMWVTNPMLEDGLKLINGWGFQYKTNFVWIKKNHTAGFYVFGQHELLLIAVKGSKMLPTGEKFKSIITGNNNKHSKKPESVYEMIEKMYPDHKYLEIFARNTRKGWDSFGNEL